MLPLFKISDLFMNFLLAGKLFLNQVNKISKQSNLIVITLPDSSGRDNVPKDGINIPGRDSKKFVLFATTLSMYPPSNNSEWISWW